MVLPLSLLLAVVLAPMSEVSKPTNRGKSLRKSKVFNEWSVNTRWFGFTALRHNRAPGGGPLVWTVYLRFGQKKLLAPNVCRDNRVVSK